ncbi:MAG: hypothetical protein IJB15_11500, partial [Clostridia bacterium]|nr:hypothetical protein [Clostridia bacterium]
NKAKRRRLYQTSLGRYLLIQPERPDTVQLPLSVRKRFACTQQNLCSSFKVFARLFSKSRVLHPNVLDYNIQVTPKIS